MARSRPGLSLMVALVAAFAAMPLAAARADSRQPFPKPKPRCERPAFRVLLDVGHTADDPGARSARSATEFEFNLRLAREIERNLKDSGFTQTVVLVSKGPAIAALISRMRRANAAPADLFLSIHHDSVPEHFLESWLNAGSPARFSDRFRGHSIFVSFENRHLKESLHFASLLGSELKVRDLNYTPHYTERFMGSRQRELLDNRTGVYRFDKLYVLRTARMPAVLFEAGMIVNREEELALATPERRSTLALAATDAIEGFCGQRQAATKAVAGRHDGTSPAQARPHPMATGRRPTGDPQTARLLR
ncbi:MAG: N-acetylmuramoyl-L-alanine amidase [Pseudorhodoplanes sp.]|nr:MAG: N-acetylmuramoyl-L-alanine amidase [Pseudorhodoplanes sp.]